MGQNKSGIQNISWMEGGNNEDKKIRGFARCLPGIFGISGKPAESAYKIHWRRKGPRCIDFPLELIISQTLLAPP